MFIVYSKSEGSEHLVLFVKHRLFPSVCHFVNVFLVEVGSKTTWMKSIDEPVRVHYKK